MIDDVVLCRTPTEDNGAKVQDFRCLVFANDASADLDARKVLLDKDLVCGPVAVLRACGPMWAVLASDIGRVKVPCHFVDRRKDFFADPARVATADVAGHMVASVTAEKSVATSAREDELFGFFFFASAFFVARTRVCFLATALARGLVARVAHDVIK